ncbi:MAG: hypothetical protein ACM3KR_09655 [Deltaproteobacteria bacterium]
MENSNQNSAPTGLGFAHANINTLVIMDEPEENTIIYAWKDGGFKKLPYDEHIAKSGQKVKTFMTPNKMERVTIVTINKEELCITLTVGIIENNELKVVGKPLKQYGDKNLAKISQKYVHSSSIDNPVLFFSLDPDNFGEEIKGKVVRE